MAYDPDPRQPMFSGLTYCTRCGMPSTEPLATFDELGVCVTCLASEQKMHIDWTKKEKDLRTILARFKGQSASGYDCLVPISGGKDSAFQLHMLTKVHGLRPLACTFSHNWWSETGWRNLWWSIETFNVDHVLFTPSRSLVNRCAKHSLKMIGDSCWHCHAGVGSYPIQVAVQYKIPLIVYGESAAEKSATADYENILQYDETYFTKVSAFYTAEEFATQGLSERELAPFKIPGKAELDAVGFYGIHLGNFMFWDEERQMEFLRDHYGWQEDTVGGTYKCYKSVECRMPGVHDFTKFLKRGYGRGTDHATQDVRAGLMTREEANRLIRENDPVEPEILDYYLQVTGYSREEFYAVMDGHREKLGFLSREEIAEALADAARRKAERLQSAKPA